jgi:predicted alpha/beta superfamily hydrolase
MLFFAVSAAKHKTEVKHSESYELRFDYLVGSKALAMRLVASLVLLYTNLLFGQNDSNIHSFTLHSTILKEDRFFQIYIPSSRGKLDVIYVLDGQTQFSTVLNILKKDLKGEKLIVGIGNIWLRERDYTPTKVHPSPFVDTPAAKISGGGENFIRHLEKELIPYVNEHYPASNSRILIGHSFGGLLAIEILLKHTTLFNKYAAIDPSLWWDEGKLLQSSKELLKKSYPDGKFFLAIANTRNKDKSTIEAIKQYTSEHTALIRPSTIFLDYLNEARKNNLTYTWKYYKDSEHMTVFRPAVTDALRFLLQE